MWRELTLCKGALVEHALRLLCKKCPASPPSCLAHPSTHPSSSPEPPIVQQELNHALRLLAHHAHLVVDVEKQAGVPGRVEGEEGEEGECE